jgi:hypothetical protein
MTFVIFYILKIAATADFRKKGIRKISSTAPTNFDRPYLMKSVGYG